MIETVLFLLGAYLWGGIPSAYLVARYTRGIDIRDFGSGNVGASNLMAHVGMWTGLWLGVFDCVGKGALPVIVANLMDQSLSVQAGMGLAAIAGHNWSPYIRFTGGRGVATFTGVLFGLFMWKVLLTEAFILVFLGRVIFHSTAFWTLVSVLALPLLTYLYGQPADLVYMSGTIPILILLKRLTANWEMPGREYPLLRVLAYRLLWDRDVARREEWTTRRPPSEKKG